MKPDGKLTTSDVETANVLNTAFHSVFSKEDKSALNLLIKRY